MEKFKQATNDDFSSIQSENKLNKEEKDKTKILTL